MKRRDKVSVSTIDAWRLMTQEVISEDDLVSQINRTGETTEAMQIGNELGYLLEYGIDRFRARNPNPIIDPFEFERYIEPQDRIGLPEFWIGGEICGRWIAARADLIIGREIREFKVTGQFDAEKYLGSMQWRLYLHLARVDKIIYRVFERAMINGRVVPKGPAHTLPLMTYIGIEQDCIDALKGFEAWERSAVERGLIRDWRAL